MEPAICTPTRQLVVSECKVPGSSRAENNMFRLVGPNVVNMTTIPEVVLTKE